MCVCMCVCVHVRVCAGVSVCRMSSQTSTRVCTHQLLQLALRLESLRDERAVAWRRVNKSICWWQQTIPNAQSDHTGMSHARRNHTYTGAKAQRRTHAHAYIHTQRGKEAKRQRGKEAKTQRRLTRTLSLPISKCIRSAMLLRFKATTGKSVRYWNMALRSAPVSIAKALCSVLPSV